MDASGWWVLGVSEGLLLLYYAVADLITARWLPWWRRYLPTGLLMLRAVLVYAPGASRDRSVLAGGLVLLAVVAHSWNVNTAAKNKRNGKDQRKLEASRSERLTEVQAASFRRQVMEGT